MESFEGFRKSGTFIVAPGVEVQGDLILKGAKTTLDLYAQDFFSTSSLLTGWSVRPTGLMRHASPI